MSGIPVSLAAVRRESLPGFHGINVVLLFKIKQALDGDGTGTVEITLIIEFIKVAEGDEMRRD